MTLKQSNMTTSVVYELMDKEGFELWRKDNPLSEENSDVMLTRFFRIREDMTQEDLSNGIDPMQEVDGG